jgi:hypothetical protein
LIISIWALHLLDLCGLLPQACSQGFNLSLL